MWVISEEDQKTSYSEDYTLRILGKKTWLIYVDLAGPEQKMAVPPLRPRHKFNKKTQLHIQNIMTAYTNW